MISSCEFLSGPRMPGCCQNARQVPLLEGVAAQHGQVGLVQRELCAEQRLVTGGATDGQFSFRRKLPGLKSTRHLAEAPRPLELGDRMEPALRWPGRI